MKSITLRLTVDVTFESEDGSLLDVAALHANLKDIPRNAASKGLMSQGTVAIVTSWDSEVKLDLSKVTKAKPNTPEHEAFKEAIMDIADSIEGGISRSGYSGRGMFGALCYGVEGDNQFELIAAISRAGLPNPKLDSMGLGVIAYWPGIEGYSRTMNNKSRL